MVQYSPSVEDGGRPVDYNHFVAESPAPSPPPRRRRRWLRRALIVLALLGLVLGAGVYYLTRPAQLTAIIAAVIEGVVPVDAQIHSAHLSLNGQLTLDGVHLRLPGQTGQADQLFDADQVLIDPGFTRLLRGEVTADSIVLVKPTLHLTEDLQTGRFNIQNLATDEEPGEIPHSLPEVHIRGGRIQFGEVVGERFNALGDLRLEGRLLESRQTPGEYVLVVRQEAPTDAGDEPRPVVRGTIQMGPAFHASAILEHFSIEAPHRNLLPRRLREWWDQLSPRGSLPTVEVSYDSDPNVGLHAVIAIERGALSLPYGDFAPRMTEVSARFVVRGDTIHVERLAGKVAGIRYTIGGVIHGFEPDAAFDLTASTEPFTIAENPYFVTLLPPKIREHYGRFNPSGRFAASVHLRRPQRGGNLHYSGELAVLEGRGAYHKFPFPLQDVKGTIRFSEQKVEILELRGNGPGGGHLVITGEIAPPGNGAAVDLRIVATDVPLDQHLLDAMKDKHRKVVDMFLNQRRYQALVSKGLIRSSDPLIQALAPPGADDAPLFDLGGALTGVIEVDRPFGDDVDTRVTTTLDTTGGGLLCEAWPYPLKSAGGTLIIGHDSVVLDQIQARGLTGGRGVVDGVIERPARDRLIPRIELRNVRLPIDELLLASLPDPQDQWVRELGVEGVIAGNGRVFDDERGKVDFSLTADFTDASADPFRARAAPETAAQPPPASDSEQPDADDASPSSTRLHDLTGSFTVTRSHLDLDRLSAHNDDTTLSISGGLDWSADPIDINLRLSATGLELGPNLLAFLPEDHAARTRLNHLLTAYRPTSRFAGELDYRSRTERRAEDFTLTVKPANLAFDWRGQRVTFDAVTGTVVLRPGEIQINDLAAELEHGTAAVAGRIPFGGHDENPPPWALRITASGDGFDANTRALMPNGLVDAIDGLALTGQYNLAGSLIGRGDQTTFDGRIALSGATADVGVPIRGLDGDLTVTAVQPSDKRWPELDLRLEARTLRIADRVVEPFVLHMVTGDRPDVLQIQEMTGTIYNGTLIGEGAITLGGADDPGFYQFDFTLGNVDVDPVISPLNTDASGASASDARASASDAEADAGGKLSASLAIEAVPGRPDTRSGRGDLVIRDARLFDKPLTMAILHAANLSLPTHRAFDRASARYLVDGDTIRFDSLRFESPAVAIIGAGTMDYPTQQLDLALITRNPGAPHLGAISDLLNVFKDELLAIHVTGTLDNPNARLVPFEGLRESWQRIFGPGAAQPLP